MSVMTASDLKRYSALHVVNGGVRRLTFEAADETEAQQLATRWGVGVEGEAPENGSVKTTLPEAYDLETTQRLLGGVSRQTVWKWITLGKLERVRDIRRVLVTRKSIERLAVRN